MKEEGDVVYTHTERKGDEVYTVRSVMGLLTCILPREQEGVNSNL